MSLQAIAQQPLLSFGFCGGPEFVKIPILHFTC